MLRVSGLVAGPQWRYSRCRKVAACVRAWIAFAMTSRNLVGCSVLWDSELVCALHIVRGPIVLHIQDRV